MGQYTDPLQANLITGGREFANVQNYLRHEVRATAGQYFDIARTSHVLKAGIGYEFAEERLNRLANGWGSDRAGDRERCRRRCARATSRRSRRRSVTVTPIRSSCRTT